jgi:hypothetical protein
MGLEDSEGDKEYELIRIVIGPKYLTSALIIDTTHLPEANDLIKVEFPLEGNQDPAETEEQVQRTGTIEMGVKFWIHDSNELLQGTELAFHPALIAKEVGFLIFSDARRANSPSCA